MGCWTKHAEASARERVLNANGETDTGQFVIRCRICDRKLLSVSFPVVYRPNTRAELNLVRSDEHGVKCEHCKQVTVFVRHPRALTLREHGELEA